MTIYGIITSIILIVYMFKYYKNLNKINTMYRLEALKKHLKANMKYININFIPSFTLDVDKDTLKLHNYNITPYFSEHNIHNVGKKYTTVMMKRKGKYYEVAEIRFRHRDDVKVEKLYTMGEVVEIKELIQDDIQNLVNDFVNKNA